VPRELVTQTRAAVRAAERVPCRATNTIEQAYIGEPEERFMSAVKRQVRCVIRRVVARNKKPNRISKEGGHEEVFLAITENGNTAQDKRVLTVACVAKVKLSGSQRSATVTQRQSAHEPVG